MSKTTTRHDTIGAAYVNAANTVTGIYRKCPHCGMVDHHYSAQGANQAHHQITRVGALLKYECGKCRKRFHVFEVCVPANADPFQFYDTLRTLADNQTKE